MATPLNGVSERKKKKRKRKEEHKEIKRKLLVGQKIEVRSTEEGFHGSWHVATIIGCDDLVCRVRYENLLADDGSMKLIESISAPFVTDGGVPGDGIPVYHRGLIRPEPPPIEIHQWDLRFGLCVDAYVEEAWWEGVIFDHEDGLDERLVFFPDLGDQLLVKIEHLRLTQDWDEVLEGWKLRGEWLFLELVLEYEKEWPVCVSLRQLWYDVRVKEAFVNIIREWTCWVRSMWDELVLDAIRDSLNLTAEYVCSVIDQENAVNLDEGRSERARRKRGNASKCKFDQIEETQSTSASIGDISLKHETNSSKPWGKRRPPYASDEIVSEGHVERCTSLQLELQNENRPVSDSNCFTGASIRNMVDPLDDDLLMVDGDCYISNTLDDSNAICSDPKLFAHISSVIDKGDPTNNKLREDEVQLVVYRDTTNGRGTKDNSMYNEPIAKPKSLALRGKGVWLPAGRKVLPGAEYCPDALVNYLHIAEEGISCHKDLKYIRRDIAAVKARMHLSHMGWKIEMKNDNRMVRVRYIPPKGRTMYSLLEICKDLTKTTARVPNRSLQNGRKYLVDMPVDSLDSSVQQIPFVKSPEQHQGSEGGGSTMIGTNLVLDLSKREAKLLSGASASPPPCAEIVTLNFSKRKITPRCPDSHVVIEPEYCPQAVVDLFEHGSWGKIPDNQSGNLSSLRLKARKHLLSVGWKLWYAKRQEIKCELRYISPQGRCYYSLRTACKRCMEGLSESKRVIEGMICSEESKVPLTDDNFPAIICTKVKENILPINGQSEEGCAESSSLPQSKELLQFSNVQVKRVRGPRKRRKNNSFPLAYRLLQNLTNPSLHYRQDEMDVAVSCCRTLGHPLDHNADSQEWKKRKTSRVLTKKGDRLVCSYTSHVLRSNKKARQVRLPSHVHHTPRSVLSWLIDNNIVLPRSKVHYRSRKDQRSLAEGRITRDGIRCNCCQKIFSLNSFEAHAGSTYHRPAARIFLDDGRSLLDCQKQMIQDNKLNTFTQEPYLRIKSNQPHIENDYICSICHYGGTLVLCDQCPSSFHLSCLGLEDLPEGKWFCPSCQCGICGQGEFSGKIEQFTEKTILCCDQCGRQYHVGCIRNRGAGKLHGCPKGYWFCSKKCVTIFTGLHKLLGKAIPVGVDNLSWTLLKFLRDGYHKNAFDIETMTEHYSKLNVALGVMHECFEPIKEPHTKDLVKDVLFNERSVLNRLNFQGFYTVLLEREDELISVATVRVYGEKVAEVPLVGTRVQFRRRGMCRILMNVLEKKLKELGVERLVLPAVPQLLHAWTTSFGFSKMKHSERFEFLGYTFLDFQGTTMCQKILRMKPTAKLTEPRKNQHELGSELNQSNENIDSDKYGIVSKVIRAEQSVGEQTPVETTMDIAAFIDCAPNKMDPPLVVTPEFNQQNNEMSTHGKRSKQNSDEENKDRPSSNGHMKYYRRRKPVNMKYYRRRKMVGAEPISSPVTI